MQTANTKKDEHIEHIEEVAVSWQESPICCRFSDPWPRAAAREPESEPRCARAADSCEQQEAAWAAWGKQQLELASPPPPPPAAWAPATLHVAHVRGDERNRDQEQNMKPMLMTDSCIPMRTQWQKERKQWMKSETYWFCTDRRNWPP